MTIALVKRAATNPAKRLGALVINPGGPGGSGVDFVRSMVDPFEIEHDPVTRRLAARHDLIGFDPRGVGASTPRPTCPANDVFEGSTRSETVASMTQSLAPLLAKCASGSGPIAGSAGTVDVARDLEQLRAALGEPKLNFLGYSYGTYLGAVYVTLFPGSAGKVVLDGGIDPDQYVNRPLVDDVQQAAATQGSFIRFLKASKRNPLSGRGLSLKRYRKFVARLDRKPMRVRGSKIKRLTGDDVRGIVGETLASRSIWELVAGAITDASKGKGRDVDMLATFAEALQLAGDEFEQQLPPFFAISAADRVFAPGAINDAWVALVRAASADFSDAWVATLGEALWPVSAPRFAGPWNYAAPAGAPPVLVVGTRFDPRTPYAGSVALRQQLGNARLLTFEGDGHGAFNNGVNGGCVDDHVLRYLESGDAPADGATCVQKLDPLGVPLAAGAARGRPGRSDPS